MPHPRVNVPLWIFFAILALSYLSIATFTVVLALRAADWPKVDGRILSSAVGVGCGRGTGPRPDVRYEYQFGSRLYKNSRIAFDTDFCGIFGTETEVANHYSQGQLVSVYVNPERPNQSALLAGTIQSATIINVLVSALLLAVSAYNLARAWRGRAQSAA
jgi:Protein of unknown function (DUF3592)